MKIVRQGDMNQMKAVVIKPGTSTDVLVNARQVALKGKSMVKEHPKPGKGKHPKNPISKGCETVLVNGAKLAFLTVPDKCKHKMIKGSDDVLCEGKMG